MPKLWTATIEGHRREVRAAVIEATARLVAERGLLAVTMSSVAEATGIGRATLYKYFPDVEAIVLAWHESQIAEHLDQLRGVRERSQGNRLEAVLEAYALMVHDTNRLHDPELHAFLHSGRHVSRAQQQLHALVRDLVAERAAAGAVTDDVPPDELASYCVHALAAAGTLPSKASVRRLVAVTLAALRPVR